MSAFFSGWAIKILTVSSVVMMLGAGRVARSAADAVAVPVAAVASIVMQSGGSGDEDNRSADTTAAPADTAVTDTISVRSTRSSRIKYSDLKDGHKTVKISISDKGVRVGSEDGEDYYLQLDGQEISKSFEEALDKLDDVDIDLSGLIGLGELGGDNREFTTVYSNQVVRFGEDIEIGKYELVRGDVLVLFGDVEVEGKVTGDVVSILGDVDLGPSAIVNGEVVSVLGAVHEDDDARVRGQTVVVGGARFVGVPFRTNFGGGIFRVVGKLLSFIVGALLLLLILYFLPDRMRRVSSFVSTSFFKSLGMGILVLVFGSIVVGIVAAVLSITIIGIPVAVLLVLSYGALILAGYFASALAAGVFLADKLKLETDSLIVKGILGLFAIGIFGFISSMMWFGPVFFASNLLRLLNGLIGLLAVLAGVGAVLLSKVGMAGSKTAAELPEAAGEEEA